MNHRVDFNLSPEEQATLAQACAALRVKPEHFFSEAARFAFARIQSGMELTGTLVQSLDADLLAHKSLRARIGQQLLLVEKALSDNAALAVSAKGLLEEAK